MDKLGDFMGEVLAQKGLAGASQAAQICFWADEWGKGRFRPISFFRGTLKVSVDCASAAQELSMDVNKLIKHLNSKLGREAIKQVRIENHEQ